MEAYANTQRMAMKKKIPAVPAVRTGRIYLVVGDEFVVPGPRIVIAIRRLAQILHPDAFR